jgi:hypothetical protein
MHGFNTNENINYMNVLIQKEDYKPHSKSFITQKTLQGNILH